MNKSSSTKLVTNAKFSNTASGATNRVGDFVRQRDAPLKLTAISQLLSQLRKLLILLNLLRSLSKLSTLSVTSTIALVANLPLSMRVMTVHCLR